MPRNRKYLTERNRHDWTPDKVEILFSWIYFSDEPDSLGKDKYGYSYLKPPGLENSIRVHRESPGKYLISHFHHTNVNLLLREHFAAKYKMTRFESDHECGLNVIPSKLWAAIKADGLSVSEVRKVGFDLYFEQIRLIRRRIRSCLREALPKIELPPGEPTYSLQHFEASYDVLTRPGVELARMKKIRRRFTAIVDTSSPARFIDSGASKNFVQSSSSLKSVSPEHNYRQSYTISGTCSDATELVFYLKEASKYGTVNRLEARAFDYAQFKELCGGNNVESEQEFIDRATMIAHKKFDNLMEIFNADIHYSNNEKRRIVRALCIRYYGNSFGHIAFEALWRGQRRIFTGKRSASDRRLFSKTRELAKKGVLVERVGRRGVYRLNWSWIIQIGSPVLNAGLISPEVIVTTAPRSRMPSSEVVNVSNISAF